MLFVWVQGRDKFHSPGAVWEQAKVNVVISEREEKQGGQMGWGDEDEWEINDCEQMTV